MVLKDGDDVRLVEVEMDLVAVEEMVVVGVNVMLLEDLQLLNIFLQICVQPTATILQPRLLTSLGTWERRVGSLG